MKMTIQVLVTSVKQSMPQALAARMNIQGKVLICNQAFEMGDICLIDGGGHTRMVSTTTIGVGINRNVGLMYCDADICLLADDDMRYVDGYRDMVNKAFDAHPEADVIVFNVASRNSARLLGNVGKNKRASRTDLSSIGIHGVAARVASIRRANIWFSPMFGGGAKYGSGEDAIFLQDLVKKGLTVWLCSKTIAYADQSNSTWFHGYSEKYFMDKGALFSAAYPRLCRIIALRSAWRYKLRNEVPELSWRQIYKMMVRGIDEYAKDIG